MWRDGQRTVRAQAVALIELAQARVELLGDWRREEVVELERRLGQEAGGERFHRAPLEVRRVYEFGEEGDVVCGQRRVQEGPCFRVGVRLELGRRGSLEIGPSPRKIYNLK